MTTNAIAAAPRAVSAVTAVATRTVASASVVAAPSARSRSRYLEPFHHAIGPATGDSPTNRLIAAASFQVAAAFEILAASS